jgi:hypothetical protein
MALIATASGEGATDRHFAMTHVDLGGAASVQAPAPDSPGLADRIGGLLRRLRQRARDRMLDAACQQRLDQADTTRCDVLRIVARRHL